MSHKCVAFQTLMFLKPAVVYQVAALPCLALPCPALTTAWLAESLLI